MKNEQLIDGLYRAILGRAADPSGLGTYGGLLTEKGQAAGALGMVQALLKSEEYGRRIALRQRVVEPAFSLGTPRSGRTIGPQPFRHIISLGTHCLTSALLKKFGLKAASHPFDWLFSSPSAVLDCLENDFLLLLDARHYESITHRRSDKEPGADHRHYKKQFGIGDMFAHRDPTKAPDHAYLVRTVERFRAVLASSDPKLFVMISRPEHAADALFPSLSRKLRAMTENSAFLCIQLRAPTGIPACQSTRKVTADGLHELYEFIPSSGELGVQFDEPLDDAIVLCLLKTFSFAL